MRNYDIINNYKEQDSSILFKDVRSFGDLKKITYRCCYCLDKQNVYIIAKEYRTWYK